MADHLKPTITSTYANFVTELDARFDDLAVGLDPAVTTATNLPTGSIRWVSASNKWQKFNGSGYVDLSSLYSINISGNAGTVTNGIYTTGSYSNPSFITSLSGTKITGDISGNSGSATKLFTARNINGVAFDGTAAISLSLNNNVTFNNAGTGSASGVTFNGGTATTISYNTVGAPSTAGAGASGTWGISISGNAATASSAADVTIAVLAKIYPIGSIYVNAAVATNPSTLLGFGTWTAFGAGRVLIGVDGTDALFNTLGETGGSKDSVLPTHTHTATMANAGAATGAINTATGDFGNIQSASGVFSASGSLPSRSQGTAGTGSLNTATLSIPAHAHTITVDSAGVSPTNTNVQPSITVSMWRRTA
jgi:hypothetical protein